MSQVSSWRPVFFYSGGKSQIASRIVALFRERFPTESRLLSPFLGGGAVELRFMHARRGWCQGADIEQPLINLWSHLAVDAPGVAEHARALLPMTADVWESWYQDMQVRAWTSIGEAARYWLMRQSKVIHSMTLWVRLMERFNAPKKHRPALAQLSRFRVPRLSVEHADFRAFLARHDGVCYVDSPYWSDRGEKARVYSNREETNLFSVADHADLADILCKRKGWVMSNSDTAWVRDRYRDFDIIPVRVRYPSRQIQGMENIVGELLIVCPF